MAISHLCLKCGFDLARTHPIDDPHYGLKIIICPRCAAACTRRTHPIWQTWTTLRRLDWSIGLMVIQLLLLGAMLFVTVTMIMASAYWLMEPELADRSRWFWSLLGALIFLLPVLVGGWLRSCYAHWSWSRALIVFGLLVLIGLCIADFMLIRDRYFAIFTLSASGRFIAPATITEFLAMPAYYHRELLVLVAGTGLLAWVLLVSPAGIPGGILAHRTVRWIRRWQWRRRRKRRRARLVTS